MRPQVRQGAVKQTALDLSSMRSVPEVADATYRGLLRRHVYRLYVSEDISQGIPQCFRFDVDERHTVLFVCRKAQSGYYGLRGDDLLMRIRSTKT